jgi:hypothetical protein
MVNFDRPTSTFSSRLKAMSSARFGVTAMAAVGALALVTGLSTPAVAGTPTSHAPAVVNVAMVSAAKVTTAAAQAAPVAVKAAPVAVKAAPVAAVAAPSLQQLHPIGNQGLQATLPLSPDLLKNAQAIIQTGQAMGLPPRAWVIAVATSIQETKLVNCGYLGASNDADSLGLFQQRPSSGWGSPAQLQDPHYAATAFYKALIQVPNWDKMPLSAAAQAVQVSAYPDRYAQWEAQAGDIVRAFYGQGPVVSLAHQVM